MNLQRRKALRTGGGLTLLTLGLIILAFAFYPTLFQLAWQAKTQLVETRYAPETLNQRETVKMPLPQMPAGSMITPEPLDLDESMGKWPVETPLTKSSTLLVSTLNRTVTGVPGVSVSVD